MTKKKQTLNLSIREFLVLKCLYHNKETYGYNIKKQASHYSNGAYELSLSSIYSILHKFLKIGMIKENQNTTDEETAVTYSITLLGQETFKANQQNIKQILKKR